MLSSSSVKDDDAAAAAPRLSSASQALPPVFLDGPRLSHRAAAGSAQVRFPQKKAPAVLGFGPLSGAGAHAAEQGVYRVRESTLLVQRRRPREQPNSERVAGRVGSESGRHGASVHAE